MNFLVYHYFFLYIPFLEIIKLFRVKCCYVEKKSQGGENCNINFTLLYVCRYIIKTTYNVIKSVLPKMDRNKSVICGSFSAPGVF